LSYDENDGMFDHVTPPIPPAGTGGVPVQDLEHRRKFYA